MPYERAIAVLDSCKKLGAKSVTLVGGEPALHPDLPRIVEHAVHAGYEKVFIDTNALSLQQLMRVDPDKVTYIRVSLDGATPEVHDTVRGTGTHSTVIGNIRELVNAGYKTAITSTVFQFSIKEAPQLLSLAENLGISLVNYHVFSEEGAGTREPDWSLSPHDWIRFYEFLEEAKHRYNMSIWYPPTWATPERLATYVDQGYRGCLGCSLDRLSIFPDGKCYVCSVLFDLPVHYGSLDEEGHFVLNRDANEFEMFTQAVLSASEPWLSGCPAERVLEEGGKRPTPQGLVSVCRCWKSQV
jgi:MoaA/NifB/PqqE/SkfB family radical SAM enzyme